MTVRTLTVREHVRSYPDNAVKRATTERLRAEVERTVSRKSFNRKERERLFKLYGGLCYLCMGRINPIVEAFEIEHEIPWEISRDDSDANLKLAHVKCHTVKTARDRQDIAKVHRMEAKHNGTFPPSRNPIQSRGFAPARLWPASTRDHDGD